MLDAGAGVGAGTGRASRMVPDAGDAEGAIAGASDAGASPLIWKREKPTRPTPMTKAITRAVRLATPGTSEPKILKPPLARASSSMTSPRTKMPMVSVCGMKSP